MSLPSVREDFGTYRLSVREETMLTSLTRHIATFLQSEDGPTAVEYAVMLALIIVVCVAAIQTLGTNANAKFQSVATTLGS
jgi:pilus assembly protein Flp/PilA